MVDEFVQWGLTVVKKVGFIVEGGTEKILLESEAFSSWLRTMNLQLIEPVVDAKGAGNLLPNNIGDMILTLKKGDADYIFILTDLEKAPSIQDVKDRLAHAEVEDCFVTVLAIESWFLASTEPLRSWLPCEKAYIDEPESKALDKPFERIKTLKLVKSDGTRGCSNKKILARQMLLHGFSFEQVLAHPNCSSMKYMEKVLKNLP